MRGRGGMVEGRECERERRDGEGGVCERERRDGGGERV